MVKTNDILPGLHFIPSGVSWVLRYSFESEAFLFGGLNCADGLGHFSFVLPFDIPTNLGLVQSEGGDEVPDTPDPFFVKIHLTDELEALT